VHLFVQQLTTFQLTKGVTWVSRQPLSLWFAFLCLLVTFLFYIIRITGRNKNDNR